MAGAERVIEGAAGTVVSPVWVLDAGALARRGFMGYPGDASTNFGAYIEPVYDVDIAGAGFARLPESRLVSG